jgi:hypothetical protein
MSDPDPEAVTLGVMEPSKRKPDYTRLSRAEVASVVALHRAGKTQTEIALTLGCNTSTVSRWLNQLGDTTELAKQKLRAGSAELVDRVLKRADIDQSLEVLDRLDVAPKRERNASNGNQVNIVIGMPGAPAGPDPMITVSPVTFAPACAEIEQAK